MNLVTKGDIDHHRWANSRTPPVASRRWHEEVTLVGYYAEEDLIVFRGDSHYFGVERGLIEEIVASATAE